MNKQATLPVIVLFDGESNRSVLSMTRVPCAGEFIHIAGDNKATMAKVLVVTHLAWKQENPEAFAEVHCVRVNERLPDKLRAELAEVERSQDHNLWEV